MSLKCFIRKKHILQFLLLNLSNRSASSFAFVQAEHWEHFEMTSQQSSQLYEILTRAQLIKERLSSSRIVALKKAMQIARSRTSRLKSLAFDKSKKIKTSYDVDITLSHSFKHNWHTFFFSEHLDHNISRKSFAFVRIVRTNWNDDLHEMRWSKSECKKNELVWFDELESHSFYAAARLDRENVWWERSAHSRAMRTKEVIINQTWFKILK
jgi:hypothetical protein